MILATIETSPPLRVYLESAADAPRLAYEIGHRVTIEQTYEPVAPKPKRVARSNGKSATATSAGAASQSLPEQVRQRINANPNRAFSTEDFEDLGTKKAMSAVLFRLKKKRQVQSPSRGMYQALRGAPQVRNPAEGATARDKVLAFMRQHPGEWMRAADVTLGMGLASDRRSAVSAALNRLAPSQLHKDGGRFCFPRVMRQEAQH